MSIQPDPWYQRQYDQGQQSGQDDIIEDVAIAAGIGYLLARHGDSTWLFLLIYGWLWWICGWHPQVPLAVLGISAVLWALSRLFR